ncbi:MAG: hypothetical protein V4657_07290 [Pseudomonadota bacterium]
MAPWEKYQTAPASGGMPAPIIRFPEKPTPIPSGYEPNPSGGIRPIPGGPDDKPKTDPNAPKLGAGWRWKNGIVNGEAELIPGLPPPKGTDGAKTEDAKTKTAANIRDTLAKLDEIENDVKDNGGWFETGATGAFSRKFLPQGTAASDLESRLKPIVGSNAFTALTALADQGIKLTPISNEEIKLAASSVANLDPNQSQEAFLASLADARKKYQDVLLALDPNEKIPDASGAKRPAMVGGFAVGTDVTFNGGGDQPFDRDKYLATRGLNSQQESNIMSFLNENRGNEGFSIEALNDYYDEIGVPRLDPSAAAEMVSSAKKGYQFGPIDTKTAEQEYMKSVGLDEKAQAEILANRDTAVQGNADAIVRGAADTVTLGMADEIAAIGETVFNGGTMESNLAKQRFVDRADEEVNPLARFTGQVAGGLALPGTATTSVARNAGVAGAYGTGYGFGSGEGSFSNRLSSAAKTGIVSAVAGGGLTSIANRFGRPKAGDIANDLADSAIDEIPSPLETYQAGKRIGVTPLPADVGGPTTRLLSAATSATPGGVSSMVKGAEGVQEGLKGVRDRVARQFGKAEEAEGAGEAATRGALKFRSDSRDAAGRLYERARNVSQDVKIAPTKAVETLDANLADLAQIPGSSGLASTLQGFKDEITKLGDLTVDGVRGMRTVMRDRFMKDGLVGSDTERRINQVIDSAAEDMADGLQKAGNIEAAALFRQADTAWKERAAMMNDVIMPIIGKRGEKSGEQVFKALQAAATGNNSKFTQFMKSLPDAERDTLTASLVDKLGRADDYGGFSLLRFLGDYGKMGKSAKQALFSPQARAQLDDLATMARGSKASQAYLNRSNTGLTLTTGGTAALAFDSIVSMGMALGGQFAAGKILTSPTVTKVLSKFARAKSPQAKATILSDLSNVAIRQPAIANDVLALQEGLLRSLSASPGRLAASENEGNRGPKPPAQ